MHLLSEQVDCAVVNASDDSHEHPTQALLDALTIRQRQGRLGDLTVAICGDILHSRVARSNIALLNTVGVWVRVVVPSCRPRSNGSASRCPTTWPMGV
jgi:aspartate carbamoyltransferase catalytic subunit